MNSQLHTEVMDYDSQLAEVDMRDLQQHFADLFDRSLEAVVRLGLDQDDVVFDRILVCRLGETAAEVSADWLSSKDRLVAHVLALLQDGAPAAALPTAEGVQVTGLKVIVRKDDSPTVSFRAP